MAPRQTPLGAGATSSPGRAGCPRGPGAFRRVPEPSAFGGLALFLVCLFGLADLCPAPFGSAEGAAAVPVVEGEEEDEAGRPTLPAGPVEVDTRDLPPVSLPGERDSPPEPRASASADPTRPRARAAAAIQRGLPRYRATARSVAPDPVSAPRIAVGAVSVPEAGFSASSSRSRTAAALCGRAGGDFASIFSTNASRAGGRSG